MSQLSQILNRFEPIALEEMDAVKLMNRTEQKFIFSFQNLEEILPLLLEDYKVLDVNGAKMSRYKSLYYDTPDMRMYTMHHNGKLNRYKIRHRTYVENGIGFIEVKFKNNKGRTFKKRIEEIDQQALYQEKAAKFIQKTSPFHVQDLQAVVWSNYNRVTLVNKFLPERVTIDTSLQFSFEDKQSNFHQLVIAEVKQENKFPSKFIQLMKNYHIPPGSMSKYCMGISSIYTHVKTNNFKQKLLTLSKIAYDS